MFLQSCKSFFQVSSFLPPLGKRINKIQWNARIFVFFFFFLLLKTRTLHLVDDSLGEDITSRNVLDPNKLINHISTAKILVMNVKRNKYYNHYCSYISMLHFYLERRYNVILFIESLLIVKILTSFCFFSQKEQYVMVLTYDVINRSTLNI